VFPTGAVHVSVIAAKQRDKKQRTRVTRRIKREWAPLFVEFCDRREHEELGSNPEAPEIPSSANADEIELIEISDINKPVFHLASGLETPR